MPMPPSLTPEQRSAALEKAARARRERAELKEKLKMGSVSLGSLLEKSGDDEIGISETRRVRGLGAQQRESLLKAFPSGD